MTNNVSLRKLCALCVSAVNLFVEFTHRRHAQRAELSQRRLRALVCVIPLTVFAAPAFGQAAAIQPCQPAPSQPRARLLTVDASVPADPDLEKMLAPYSEKVSELSLVIGRLDGGLTKKGIGAGTLGSFVTDAMKAVANAKYGKPVVVAIVNAGGLRKNEIAAGQLRVSDIFELLPFENALVVLDVTGAQLTQLLQAATRDAQSGARIEFKYNDRDRPEFISAKLVDQTGKEEEIDPNKTYTIVTIDYLIRVGGGAYAILKEAKTTTPLNITLRDAVISYIKAAAGRAIRGDVGNRFVQIGPGPKTIETPR
jgi:2',3'-cyclic-nucleotide 2'-phosphodiesterase (5'-nucleotidase family)